MEEGNTSSSPSPSSRRYEKFSRLNTPEEKREMSKLRRKRNKSKKKMKSKVQELKKEVLSETKLRKQAEMSVKTYKQISRTYWERWRWELHKRREALQTLVRQNKSSTSRAYLIHEIDPSMLKDPIIDGDHKETYLARGCFGIVRLQEYRQMQVAVKELLPRSLVSDAKTEASILVSLSHPYVPFLYGICTEGFPLRIVMQFHTLYNQEVSTFERELCAGHFLGTVWIILCAQIMEVIRYLHEEASILHNDIKGDNILFCPALQPEEDCQYQIVLIDFGKATKIAESKRYHLTPFEKAEYIRKYPHMPPEVIEGEQRQSRWSDVYAIGRLLYQICDSRCIHSLESCQRKKFREFAGRCRSADFTARPSSKEGLAFFEQL